MNARWAEPSGRPPRRLKRGRGQHGAMAAEGYDDCEGDTIARARDIVGPDVPIGVELDLHCHPSELMVDKATGIVTCKEYPHTDLAPRRRRQ